MRLIEAGKPLDEEHRRIGFREATFTDHGFSLNGKIVKLRGLDRHQTFPFVGQAMPALTAKGRRYSAQGPALQSGFTCFPRLTDAGRIVSSNIRSEMRLLNEQCCPI
nr:hypothetical protein [Granulicella tundricola]